MKPATSQAVEFNTGPGGEPCVAACPSRPGLLALAYRNVDPQPDRFATGVRISEDGGRSWRRTETSPWGRRRIGVWSPGVHARLTWGPRPTPGGGFDLEGLPRLWWVDGIVVGRERIIFGRGKVAIGITYSDDLGKTWAPLYLERRTPPWIGAYPDISVDCNPASPRFGAVYACYNWPAGPQGPGLRVLASLDGGKTWTTAEVPALGLAGYAHAWRIGYRIQPAPPGRASAYVSFYEANLRSWNPDDIWKQGDLSNIGRQGFAVARIEFTRGEGQGTAAPVLRAHPPRWAVTLEPLLGPGASPFCQSGLEVTPSGRLWLAVGDWPAPGRRIRLGYSDDGGETWTWSALTPEPGETGPPSGDFKPVLVLDDRLVFVGYRSLAATGQVTISYRLSFDGGATFSAPVCLAAGTSPQGGAMAPGSVGMRDSADRQQDCIYYAYGDRRPGDHRAAVYVAVIKPGDTGGDIPLSG